MIYGIDVDNTVLATRLVHVLRLEGNSHEPTSVIEHRATTLWGFHKILLGDLGPREF